MDVLSTQTADSISLEALKRRLSENFRDTGALDHVKASLRAKFVEQLNGSKPGIETNQKLVTAKKPSSERSNDISFKLAHSFVCEHLKACGFHATMSVFEPECGGGLFTKHDMLSRLGVSPHSELYQRLLETTDTSTITDVNKENGASMPDFHFPNSSMLEKLLSEVARPNPAVSIRGMLHARFCEMGTQTTQGGPSPREALDETMRRLDREHQAELEMSRQTGNLAVKTHLERFQKECEERNARRNSEEMERWKQTELLKVRNEAMSVKQKALAECRAFLTSEHVAAQEKLRNQLARREAEAMRKVEEVEAKAYLERQLLLTELSELKRRDNEREADRLRLEGQVSIEKKKLQQELSLLDSRRRELEEREDANARSVALLRREVTMEVTDRFKQQVEDLRQAQELCASEQVAARTARETALITSRKLAEVEEELLQLKYQTMNQQEGGDRFNEEWSEHTSSDMQHHKTEQLQVDDQQTHRHVETTVGVVGELSTGKRSMNESANVFQTHSFSPHMASTQTGASLPPTPTPYKTNTGTSPIETRPSPIVTSQSLGGGRSPATEDDNGYLLSPANKLSNHTAKAPRSVRHSSPNGSKSMGLGHNDEKSWRSTLEREMANHHEELSEMARRSRGVEEVLRREIVALQAEVRAHKNDASDASRRANAAEAMNDVLTGQVDDLNQLLREQASALATASFAVPHSKRNHHSSGTSGNATNNAANSERLASSINESELHRQLAEIRALIGAQSSHSSFSIGATPPLTFPFQNIHPYQSMGMTNNAQNYGSHLYQTQHQPPPPMPPPTPPPMRPLSPSSSVYPPSAQPRHDTMLPNLQTTLPENQHETTTARTSRRPPLIPTTTQNQTQEIVKTFPESDQRIEKLPEIVGISNEEEEHKPALSTSVEQQSEQVMVVGFQKEEHAIEKVKQLEKEQEEQLKQATIEQEKEIAKQLELEHEEQLKQATIKQEKERAKQLELEHEEQLKQATIEQEKERARQLEKEQEEQLKQATIEQEKEIAKQFELEHEEQLKQAALEQEKEQARLVEIAKVEEEQEKKRLRLVALEKEKEEARRLAKVEEEQLERTKELEKQQQQQQQQQEEEERERKRLAEIEREADERAARELEEEQLRRRQEREAELKLREAKRQEERKRLALELEQQREAEAAALKRKEEERIKAEAARVAAEMEKQRLEQEERELKRLADLKEASEAKVREERDKVVSAQGDYFERAEKRLKEKREQEERERLALKEEMDRGDLTADDTGKSGSEYSVEEESESFEVDVPEESASQDAADDWF